MRKNNDLIICNLTVVKDKIKLNFVKVYVYDDELQTQENM